MLRILFSRSTSRKVSPQNSEIRNPVWKRIQSPPPSTVQSQMDSYSTSSSTAIWNAGRRIPRTVLPSINSPFFYYKPRIIKYYPLFIIALFFHRSHIITYNLLLHFPTNSFAKSYFLSFCATYAAIINIILL